MMDKEQQEAKLNIIARILKMRVRDGTGLLIQAGRTTSSIGEAPAGSASGSNQIAPTRNSSNSSKSSTEKQPRAKATQAQ